MNKIWISSLLGVLFLFNIIFFSRLIHTTANTPELFGYANIYSINSNNFSIGLIDGWGYWLIVERHTNKTESQCLIFPLDKTLKDSHPIYCEKYYHDNYFSGFIYFRGHERPFCGASIDKKIPHNCFEMGKITH